MRRRGAPGFPLARGERLLAWQATPDGAVGGTRDAFYAEPEALRIPWEQVEAAAWDRDASVLRVTEVGTWGTPRPEHTWAIEEPGVLLQLVRERVTASVVLQRHVPVDGARGVRIIARRAAGGDRALTWLYEYDAGVDPADPLVRLAAEDAWEAARRDVGEM